MPVEPSSHRSIVCGSSARGRSMNGGKGTGGEEDRFCDSGGGGYS